MVESVTQSVLFQFRLEMWNPFRWDREMGKGIYRDYIGRSFRAWSTGVVGYNSD